MSDDTGQTTDGMTATDTTNAGTTTTDVPKSYVNVDGTLAEGWRDHYVDEDLRGEKIYDSIKDIKGMTRTIAHQAKLVGKKGVLLPTEASGQSVWDAFYEAIGRPTTAGDYQYQVPEDISSEDLSPEFMKNVFGKFHELGYTQKQAEGAVNLYVEHLREIEKAVDDAEEREIMEAETALRNRWGAAYDERLHLANRIVAENVKNEEHQQMILNKIGNDPIMADFLATIGSKFKEHRIITDIDTPSSDADARIAELQGKNLSPDQRQKLPYWDRSHPDHKAVINQVQQLYAQQAARRATGTAV